MSNLKDLVSKFENKQPEVVFEWSDPETEATGWVVINSLRGGAAGGGTRMRKGLDKREVESLAKTMEVKFTVSGPAIGGAKSGINFDPQDPRKHGVLKRWYKTVMPLLKNYYGTGGDLNIDEVHEVIPITSEFGLLHPQEGVVNGHFKASDESKKKRIEQLQIGVSKHVTDTRYTPAPDKKIVVADFITGYGVAEAVRHYYTIYGKQIEGKKAIIQGWGNVASAAAYYLAQMGVKVVGIVDRVGGLINENGYTFEEVKDLFLNKKGNALNAPNMLSFDEVNSKIWDVKADIFIPAAASRLITKEQVDKMIKSGIEVISCGANVPFADKEIFMGPISEYCDNHISVIPDFIANCGMARVFAYLMQENIQLTDETIFSDVSKVIFDALKKVHAENPSEKGISQTGLKLALTQLV
jgi:glutamate dehydrogenase/leucine dehydrogenase